MAFWGTRFEVVFSLCFGLGASIANAVFLLHVLLDFWVSLHYIENILSISNLFNSSLKVNSFNFM